MSDVYAREITSGAFRRLRRLTPHSHGASASTPLVDFEWSDIKRCRTELWVRRVASLALLAAEVENFSTFQAPTEASANQIASCKYPIPFMQHQGSMWLVVITMTARQHHASDTPSVKRWRRRPVWMQREPERAHTHVTHRMRVRTQITWTWLCTRGKKLYKYCSLSILHSYCVLIKTHMGKSLFSPELKSYSITQWNCTTIGSCSGKKRTNGSAAELHEPMATIPARSRQIPPKWAGHLAI